MWNKIKSSKLAMGLLIGGAALVVLLGAAAVWFFGFHMPYMQAENSMPAGGTLIITQQQDDSLLVQWPEGKNAEGYNLQVIGYSDSGEQLLHSYTGTETSCVLPQQPLDETVLLRVSSYRMYGNSARQGNVALEVKTSLQPPVVTEPQWEVDTATGKLKITATVDPLDSCSLYTCEEGQAPELVGEFTGQQYLDFGENGAYSKPAYGTKRLFYFELTTRREGLEYRGMLQQSLALTREDFLGTGLQLQSEELGSNVYKLTWNETKGDHYEVQLSTDGENWNTVHTVAKDAAPEYISEPLDAFSTFHFRVLAVGGQTLPGSEYAAEPALLQVETAQRPLYSTIWPLVDLDIYSDTAKTEKLGKAKGGQAFCVLEEKDGFFGIRCGDGVGYIDSNHCMINLPEYLGDICAYDITNSYSSLYLVHEYAIAKVSGTIITGYEQIDLGGGNFVVPLLYPTAMKLVPAALDALEQGYRIKIYDSYRPNIATREIYDLAALILNNPVPVATFTGVNVVADLDLLKWKPGQEEEETTPSTESTDPTATEAPTEPKQPWNGILEGLTYEILMTDDGRWALANFLALGASNHNRGIAIDMTLETLDGKELPMQTRIHDLSWYSEISRNNTNANKMRKIMFDNGFGGLTSEWWHFQDNDARDKLNPKALYGGVSLACWMKDAGGWRWRNADGSFVKNTSKKIDGVTYDFDSQGYATAQE